MEKLEEIVGISTGFYDLDDAIKGLNKSDLIVLASVPTIEKSSFAFNIANNVAKQNIPVAIFSLDLSKEQIVQRFKFSENVIVDDSSGVTIDYIKDKSVRLYQEKNIGLIIIDYLQLVSCNKRCNSHKEEISIISLELKKLAQELNLPVILISQLSSEPDERLFEGKETRPTIDDLAYSATLTEAADVIMFLYREDYYYLDSEGKNVIDVIIAKNKYNSCVTIQLLYMKDYFINL